MKKRIISVVAFALLICLLAVGASASQIKNIIFLIPDGAGMNTFDFANDVKVAGGFDDTKFPYRTQVDNSPMFMKDYMAGTCSTNTYTNTLTDSAAAGTALATGYKTLSGQLGVDYRGRPKANMLEMAQTVGKATGVVATYEWMHATPASFGAHVMSRQDYENIYQQMENQKIDVVLGSGYGAVSSYATIQNAADRGYTIITDRQDLEKVKPGDRLWGNATNNSSPYDINLTSSQPTLAQMTQAAITALSADEDGFFLMVEGSKVDTGAHANDAVVSSSEYIAFDEAFRVAVEFAKGRTDTIVFATPDHDTGGMLYHALLESDPVAAANAIAEAQAGTNPSALGWTTTSHTQQLVGVWFYVPEGVEIIDGLNTNLGDTEDTRNNYVIDNIAFAPYVASLMGVNMDEVTKSLFVDVTDIGVYSSATGKFTFNSTGKYIYKNQSWYYTKSGEKVDLDGKVSLYSNGRMYVPSDMVTEDDWNYVSDGTEGIQGAGTLSDPYLIDDENDFLDFTASVIGGESYSGMYFEQTADIDMSSVSEYTAMTGSNTFSGIYNGCGFEIKVNVVKDGEAAVFGQIGSGGVVMNVGITGSLTSNTTYAVGIVRKIAAGGKLVNSYSTASLSGVSEGGITMSVYGTIENCYFGGTLTKSGASPIGGIGSAEKVKNCYYVDTCGGSQTATGITAVTEQYANSALASTLEAGKADAAATAGFTEDDVCYWRQSSVNSLPELYLPVPTVTGVTVTPSSATVNKGDGIQLTANVEGEFNPSTEVSWTIETTEDLASGTKLYEDGFLMIDRYETASSFTVMAKSKVNGAVAGSAKITVGSATVTAEDGSRARPYLIENEEDYLSFVNAVIDGTNYSGKYFRQTSDIDMAGYAGYCGIPDSKSFNGVYDGAGHTINVDIAMSDDAYGVFGLLTGATVMNLGVTGSINNDNQHAAGIVRKMTDSVVINCYCSADVNSEGQSAGGIAVSNYGKIIANVYYSGTLTGSNLRFIATPAGDANPENFNAFYVGVEYAQSATDTEITRDQFMSDECVTWLNEGREESAAKAGIAVSNLCMWTLGENGPVFVKDTSGVAGAITCDTVIPSLEITTDTEITAGKYLVTFNDLSVASGAVLTLGEGTYIIENYSGSGTLLASENANVIVLSDNKPEGYVEIDIGERQTDTNVRFAEAGGKQFEIREYNDIYGVIAGKNMLVEITEKTSNEAVVATKTSYYAVDAENESYEKLDMDNYMENVNDLSVRVSDPVGIRFKSTITTASKDEIVSFEIAEYGYIIGLESTLINKGEELNFDASKYVYGAAYDKSGKDIVFDSYDDLYHVFTGVLYNIPDTAYGERIVSKTYTKISVDGKEYTVYGEPVISSIYEIALISRGLSMSAEHKAVIDSIIKKAQDMSPDLGFDVGGLYE